MHAQGRGQHTAAGGTEVLYACLYMGILQGGTELPGARVERAGDTLTITYENGKLEIDQLLPLLQRAGRIREMTVQPQNVDHMIADMYREMDL